MKKKIPAKKNRTSKKDFELFEGEFLKWVVRFGLLDWELSFKHEDVNAEATIKFCWKDKVAYVSLGTDWDQGEVTQERIKQDALHEAVHLLLQSFDHLAKKRNVTKKEVNSLNEDTTRRLVTGIMVFNEEKTK